MSPSESTGGVVVLFALEREAAPFRRAARNLPGVGVFVTGIGQAAARKAVEQVLGIDPGTADPSPELVVMAGFCGALRSGLAVGEVMVPAEVVNETGDGWRCAGSGRGRLLTTTRIVATPPAKLALGTQYQADIVDMESAAVAEACGRGGVPFLSVRAVSDAVETELSPALVRLLGSGEVSPFKAVKSLLRTPSLLREFRRLARDTSLAANTLAAAIMTAITRQRPPVPTGGR
ncbi:MAG: nucleoside phosphorylase [Gemmataceae bacterium]|nr:nucleoside phosphorylase [Gemmataceae bacterium]